MVDTSSGNAPHRQRKKILFIAEAVTLAHVGRPLALASSLSPALYDVHFACAPGYEFCFVHSDFPVWPISSIASAQFLHALAAGTPVYDEATLERYVEDDMLLLDKVKPDLVIGDFRLSLSVSARLARVRYAALVNAYWSPYAQQHYTVPNLPLTRVLPIGVANLLFRLVAPHVFRAHTVPLNRVRRTFGLPPLAPDLRLTYTDADDTWYADLPALVPLHDLPPRHAYLGPVVWSPPLAPPPWWDSLPADVPLVYVTLGSSGQGQLLPRVLEALAPLPLVVLAATAGNVDITHVPANARVAAFLPGDLAARRAALVICNGGSPTSHQALQAGVPLIGIASNLDQFLNMDGIVRSGAGLLLRADRYSHAALQTAVNTLLRQPAARQAAQKLAAQFTQFDAAERLRVLLHSVFGR